MALRVAEAAFEGFRLIRREPKLILFCAAPILLISIIQILVRTVLFKPAGVPPGVTLIVLNVVVLPMVSVVLFATALTLTGSIAFRSVLQPGRASFGALIAGMAASRLWLSWLGLYGAFLGVYVALFFAMRALFDMLEKAGSTDLAAGLVLVTGAVGFALVSWLSGRLALLPVSTFARGEIDIARAWTLTKGRIWPMLGLNGVVVVVGGLLNGLFVVLKSAILSSFSERPFPDNWLTKGVAEPVTASGYLNAGQLVWLAVGSLIGAVFYLAVTAPYAAAWRMLQDDSPESQAEVFD